MNAKIRENYEQLARAAGLHLDPEGGALYGRRGEFDVIVTASDPSYPYFLAISVSARRAAGPLTKEECKGFKKGNKPVLKLEQNGNVVAATLKNTPNQSKLQENLNAVLETLLRFLQMAGFQNCCQTCGRVGETIPCYCSGTYLHLCPDCFVALQQNQTISRQEKLRKKENVVGGLVGAFLGSLLGVACIIFFSQLGYIAALSGLVMAVCTLKGYELLGGKLTKKGIAVSLILMLVMTYVGDRVDWAILIVRELDADFIEAFQALPYLLEEELIEPGNYWGNLVMLYGFLLLGALPTVIAAIKNRKEDGKVYSLGGTPQ